jgi:hypothetical protein
MCVGIQKLSEVAIRQSVGVVTGVGLVSSTAIYTHRTDTHPHSSLRESAASDSSHSL